MKQNDNNIDWEEISDNDSEDAGESTLSSKIEEDNLDNQQAVPRLDQVCGDKIIPTTRVPLPKKWNCADTVIARTSLPNLRYPAGPWHHHCFNANSQPSTYHASLKLYPTRCSCFPRVVVAIVFLNQRPVEITTVLNTTRLLLR